MSLMEGFQAAYHLPAGRPFLKQRAVAAVLVLCAALPLLGGSNIDSVRLAAEGALVKSLGLAQDIVDVQAWVVVFGRILRYLAAFGSTYCGGLLYRIGPNTNVAFRSVWPGSLLVTLLWFAATLVFGWYVRNIANYNVLGMEVSGR